MMISQMNKEQLLEALNTLEESRISMESVAAKNWVFNSFKESVEESVDIIDKMQDEIHKRLGVIVAQEMKNGG